MRALLAFLAWRHWSHHRLRAALVVASIALGVALFVSTEVAHTSTIASFEAASRRAAGRAVWQIERARGIGIEPGMLARLEEDGRFLVAPVVEGTLSLPDLAEEGRVLLRGIDLGREGRLRDLPMSGQATVDLATLWRDPTALVLPRALAMRTGLVLGSQVRVGTASGLRTLTVGGIVDDRGAASVLGGRIVFTRLEGAQDLLGRPGRYDRLEAAPARAGVTREDLAAVVGSDARVTPRLARDRTLDDMLANIRALVVLSVIGLLVGLFIVYLSISIGVVERSRAVATLRTLGATPGAIRGTLLVEAGVLGLVGSALGIALGWLLARGMVDTIQATVNRLVRLVEVETVVLPLHAVLVGGVAGLGTSLLAAWWPARRAAGIPAAEALRPAILGTRLLPHYLRAFVVGLVLLAAGAGLVFFVQLRAPSWVGLGAMAVLFVGVALLLPQVTLTVSRLLRVPLRRWFRAEGFLAADNVMRYPQRSALTVVALGGALALMMTAASIVGGFHQATRTWLEVALPFDLSLQPARLTSTIYSGASLPAGLEERVRAVPGVETVYGVRAVVQELGDADVLLLGVDMAGYRAVLRARGLGLIGERAGPTADADLEAGRGIGISRNLAALSRLRLGDVIELASPTGPLHLPVTHITEDYSWPRGVLAMDRTLYRERWQDDALTYIDLRIAPDTTREVVRRRLDQDLGAEGGFFIYEDTDIRRYATEALEQTFQLVDAQVLVAMVIGFLGILNTLLLSVLRRQREIGLLRVVGMTPRGVARTVAIEALLISLIGGAFGIGAGLLAAAFPAGNHVLLVTGYDLPFVVPWSTAALIVGASILIGLVASVLPARRAARVHILDAIGYE
jgi:putative ABC transport system permease protein